MSTVALDRDRENQARYGPLAPRTCERLWIDPARCTLVLARPAGTGAARQARGQSAVVLEGTFPPAGWRLGPVTDLIKVASGLQRWVGGADWQETPLFAELTRKAEEARARGAHYLGLRTPEDVLRACQRYDAIFAQVQAEGRLRTRAEIDPGSFREEDGIVVHVGPGGALYHGKAGCRRFAIALALRLPTIPVMVGHVHESALAYVPALRAGG